MIDLEKIYRKCVQECKNVNIPIRDDKVVKIEFTDEDIGENLGFCILNEEYMTFSIFISSIFLEKNGPIKELKETIIHELIHTCNRCWGHGKTWMKYAKILNDKYKYELTTFKDYDAIFHKDKPILHKYICKNCGSLFNLRAKDEDYLNKNVYFACPFCGSFYHRIN